MLYPQVALDAEAVEWHHSPPSQAGVPPEVKLLVLHTYNVTVADVSESDDVVLQVTVCPGFLPESSDPELKAGA